MLDAYAPPESTTRSASGYRSLRVATWVLVAILGLAAVSRLMVSVLNGLMLWLTPSAVYSPESTTGLGMVLALFMVLAVLAWLGLTLLGIPLWVYWHWRAAANLPSLGRTGLSDTPGWHAGWWFVPIANLWKPYYALKELYRASLAEDDDWYLVPPPALFQAWWACWLLGNMASSASGAMDNVGSHAVSFYASLLSSLLSAAATALYLLWVTRISRAQARLHAASD